MSSQLPRVFVGSSVEGLRIAKAIQWNLRYVALVNIWDQNTFELTSFALEDLLKEVEKSDFAVFILYPDDVTKSRGVNEPSPRDNVIFEIGLFMTGLGRERVFLVKPGDVKVKMPTDLMGINPGTYITPPPNSDDWEAAIGPATTMIERAILRRRLRPALQEAINSSEEQFRQAAKFFEDLITDRYGVKASDTSLSLEVVELDGTARFRRNWRGIKVSRDVMITQIPGKVITSTPGSKIIEYPKLVGPITFPRAVDLKHRVSTDDRSEFDIVITGSLTYADPALDFGYESLVSNFCLMTREEVERAYQGSDFKREFVAVALDIPTDRLTLEVAFPAGYLVQAFPGVFFAETESVHVSELNRVKAGFEETSRGALFIIDKPSIGFNYIIYWISPSQEEFDKVKQGT